MTSWNHVAASGDQGIFYYVYNMSGRFPGATLRTLAHPRDADGRVFMGPGAPWWAHLQSSCKPWLVSRTTLARAKCLKLNAFFWHGVWAAATASDASLGASCPSFAAAYTRFVGIAPKEARLPCFWTEECFKKYRPAWVTSE